MSLYIASLNSGSNGNCYYVGNDREAVLIDAGISCRETENRMRKIGLSPEKLKAIFITHEHSDHIRGLAALSRKYQLPVYITPKTMRSGKLVLQEDLINDFLPHVPLQIGDLSITPFPKIHDAYDPHSFIVSGNGINIAVITDIGTCCDDVTYYFRQCHAAFLEANYDDEMLENGRYPRHLKNRIRGGKGHLSNQQALDFVLKHKPAFMHQILLSHLSKDNNHPELALGLFEQYLGQSNITVASRDEASEVFRIETNNQLEITPKKVRKIETYSQLSLF